MIISEWIQRSQSQLITAGITTARLDCLVLLEDALERDRGWILSHADQDLQGSILKNLNTKIVQRAKHIPIAYLRGHAEFYGRDFMVNEHTLVPRPETETIIELLKRVRNMEADIATFQVERRGRKPTQKQYAFEKQQPDSSLVKTAEGYKVVWQKPSRRGNLTQSPAPIHGQSLRYHDGDLYIADIGTGSGAIAITAQLEIPEAAVIATDIDEKCLETARQNAKSLGADITLQQGDLLEPLELPADKIVILLCNLPYVPDDFRINTAATHEPAHALFGGPDGLDLYRRMFAQITKRSQQPHYILTESLPPQHKQLAALAEAAGFHLQKTDDFIQLFSHD